MSYNDTYFHQQRRWYRWMGAALLVFLSIASIGLVGTAHADSTSTNAQVTIHPNEYLGTVPYTALGVNDAVWDSNLLDAQVPGLLRQDGVKVMRFPGGSTADTYHWQTNTIEPSGSSAGASTFDKFMQVVRQTGATPIITVNYGSGTPQEAAAWVKYANITRGYHIKYWEIGNEVYGNGSYGADWEYDTHAQKGPAAYATNAEQFIQAMKAVDPAINIGAVLTMPGDWPDGVIGTGDTMDWNHTVLSILGSKIDFAAVHWYTDSNNPGSESDAGLLSSTSTIAGKVATLHTLFNQYCGSKAAREQIMVTETNSVAYNPGKQTVSLVNALFLAEDYMTWLENGVANVDWWDVHNSIVTNGNTSASLYGTANYGDYGMLSVGGSANGVSEPPAETPFPAYYGLQMVHHLVGPFDRMIGASSDQAAIQVFAARQNGGRVALMLINTDASTSYTVTPAIAGHALPENATIYAYGENSTSIQVSHEHSRTHTLTLAPYSLTTIVFGW